MEKSCQNCDYEEYCTHKLAGNESCCGEWRPDLDYSKCADKNSENV